jgi:uncharacterized membrane protein
MRSVLLMVSVLAVGCVASLFFAHSWLLAGHMALACVFFFTAVGHFLKGSEMQEMIPPWFPRRDLVVFFSGLFELVLAVALVIDRLSFVAGIVAIAFLLLALPLNIYSAMARVKFGGHVVGPSYLFVRIPLQLLLIGWAYWFFLRPW